jgi:hypothetical protein
MPHPHRSPDRSPGGINRGSAVLAVQLSFPTVAGLGNPWNTVQELATPHRTQISFCRHQIVFSRVCPPTALRFVAESVDAGGLA